MQAVCTRSFRGLICKHYMQEAADLQTGITIETDNNTERKNLMMPPKEESNLLAKFDLSLVVDQSYILLLC
jgi:hypothetical protein